MKEKKVKVNIDNKDHNYKYNGIAYFNKDIIKFVDEEDIYIYDKGIERVIKESKNSRTIVDFKNNIIIISIDNKNIELAIKVKKKELKEDYIMYNYIIDNDNIVFKMDIEEVWNE